MACRWRAREVAHGGDMTMTKARTLTEAHMPTWIKADIREIRAGKPVDGIRLSYRLLGWKIGTKLDEFCEDLNGRFTDDEWNGLGSFHDGHYYLASGVNPTAILRRLFANERHPDGDGDLLQQIPERRRADFLCGVIEGVAEVG
jgi:hypothetical protein